MKINPSKDEKSSSNSDNTEFNSQNVQKDLHNIIFLTFLYLLQGVPLGLSASLPFILSSRKASYADQGMFSLTHWPFSMKLLWAPIVDSIFFKSIGRRKSWLIPMQYMIGIFMIVFANYVHTVLESDADANQTHSGNVRKLVFNLK